MRACATRLRQRHEGGDREAACLVQTTHAALELALEILRDRGGGQPHGYKDACDKLVDVGAIDAGLCERLKRVFDVADRTHAWSALVPGELGRALDEGAVALSEFADVAERHLGAGRPAVQQEFL
jgi:uncharacterized protein YutE (UPF0331/DUF86 family)